MVSAAVERRRWKAPAGRWKRWLLVVGFGKKREGLLKQPTMATVLSGSAQTAAVSLSLSLVLCGQAQSHFSASLPPFSRSCHQEQNSGELVWLVGTKVGWEAAMSYSQATACGTHSRITNRLIARALCNRIKLSKIVWSDLGFCTLLSWVFMHVQFPPPQRILTHMRKPFPPLSGPPGPDMGPKPVAVRWDIGNSAFSFHFLFKKQIRNIQKLWASKAMGRPTSIGQWATKLNLDIIFRPITTFAFAARAQQG